MSAKERAAPSLSALRGLLASARGLVDEMVDDPLVERLKRAFNSLPEADRETILKVIERDATWCQIIGVTARTSGITVHPNPHASLYVHLLDEPGPSQRDVEVISLGIARFVQLIPLFFQEGVHEQWTTSARELIRVSDPQLRSLCVKLAREVIALIDESGGEAGGAESDASEPRGSGNAPLRTRPERGS
jgi:hypothetical protein